MVLMVKHLNLRNLDCISHIASGASVGSADFVNPSSVDAVPFIRIGDLQEGTIVHSDLKYLKREIAYTLKATVEPGAVLFSTKGTIGKVAVVPKSITLGIAASQIAIIRPNQEIITPEYLSISLSSAFSKKQFEPLIKGVVLRSLPISDLQKLEIHVPRLSEQKKVVKKIRDLRRKAAQLDEKKRAIQSRITEIIEGLSG